MISRPAKGASVMGQHDDSAAERSAPDEAIAEWLRAAAETPEWAWTAFMQRVGALVLRDVLARDVAGRPPDRRLAARVRAAVRQFDAAYTADPESWGLAGVRPRDLGALLPDRLPDLRATRRGFSLLRLQHAHRDAHTRARSAWDKPAGAARDAALRASFPDVPEGRLKDGASAPDVALTVVAHRMRLSAETVRRWAYASPALPALVAREGRAGLDRDTAVLLRGLLLDAAGEPRPAPDSVTGVPGEGQAADAGPRDAS
jgi:hypothetical protein